MRYTVPARFTVAHHRNMAAINLREASCCVGSEAQRSLAAAKRHRLAAKAAGHRLP